MTIEVKLGKLDVLEDEQMPYCFLLRIEFLRKHCTSVDIGNECLMKGDKVVVRMQSGICAASFVGVLKIGLGKKELLTIGDVEEMQEECPMVCKLKECF